MNDSYEKVYHRLLSSTPLKARLILREIEENPMELDRFYRQSLRLQPGRAIMLCPLLGAMFSCEFMELLRDYALSNNKELATAALLALEKANVTARREVLVNLLETGSDYVKIRVCKILSLEGGEDAGRVIAGVLNDRSNDVIVAALSAIAKIERIAYLDKCEKFLSSSSEPVRLAALRIYEKWNQSIPYIKILDLLEKDESIEVRVLAAKVLGADISGPVVFKMLKLLRDTEEVSKVRCAIASVLSGLNNRQAGQELFHICATELYDFKLIQLARTSLIKMPENILLPICEGVFKFNDVMAKIEAIRVAGTIASDSMKDLLSRQLGEQTDEVVLATLLEESANLHNVDCWQQALLLLGESPIISYSAIQALALLLNDYNLQDFVQILNGHHEKIVYEVILARLASYGKARGLPWELSGYIEKFIWSEYPNIAVLAAEAASYVNGGALVGALLDAIGNTNFREVNHALCTAILEAVKGSMLKLIELAGAERLIKVASVISHMGDVIFAEMEFFIALTAFAEKKSPNIHLCLILAARTNIPGFIQAFEYCTGPALEAMLTAWKNLPSDYRSLKKPNWTRLLTISDPKVRLLVLQTISPQDAQDYTGYVADIAFLDPDPLVREQSIELLKKMVLLPAKEAVGIN